MVWLAKALALHSIVANPRVVIVTDRVNLDNQIWNTFRACGKSVARGPWETVRLVTARSTDVN